MSADPQPTAGAVSGSACDNDALRETSALQRAILECADYAIISTTPEGIIRTFNRAAERMLGYRAEELVGKVTPEIFHDLEEVTRRAAKLTEELGRPVAAGFEAFVARTRLGLADEQEWTYVRKNGGRVPVQLSVTAMRDEAGQIAGFLGIAHDITRRRAAQARVGQLTAQLDRRVLARTEEFKTAQMELEAGGKRFQLVVEAAPSGIIMVNREGRIVLVNAQTERLFGYSREELLGQPMDMLVPDRVRHGHAGHRTSFFAAPGARPMGTGRDLFARRKDGSEFPVEIGLNPIQTEEGTAVLGTIVDITQRKRAEEALLQARNELERRVQERTAELARLNMLLHSEVEDRKAMEAELRSRGEQLRDLFENATDLIQSVAPDGRILFVNRAWLNTLGYRMSDLATLTVFDIIHPDCLAECRAQFTRVMQGEAFTDMHAIFRAKDGRKIHVEGNASCRFENGKPVATRAIFRDISKRKAVEAERERLIQELRAALAEVKTLSGLLPVCGWCKKIRDDSGYWNSVEGYLKKSSGVDITHGICPECQAKMMADLDKVSGTPPPGAPRAPV